MKDIQRIVEAVSVLRTTPWQSEAQLHEQVAAALEAAGLPAFHEANLGMRRRIDFLCGKVGIEIKCGKPSRSALLGQLARYAQSDEIEGLVLVVQRGANLPLRVGGKPLRVVSLSKQWGISLP